MKFIRVNLLLVMTLVISSSISYGQQAVKDLSDEEVLAMLKQTRVDKRMAIGPRELQLTKYFLNKNRALIRSSPDDRIRHYNDAIVIGTVVEVKFLSSKGYREQPGYGTEVKIAVDQYLQVKDKKEDVVTLKLISGEFFKLSTEPDFKVGDRVIVSLRREPTQLFSAALNSGWTEIISQFKLNKTNTEYRVGTEGEYYELGYIINKKLPKNKDLNDIEIVWKNKKMQLPVVIEKISRALESN